ncbi:MAG TPA: GNAT family N-acetyltransferase [Acidimicrobiales bacterium]|nr:GNAT family N-acetyltransferase [Acidimicrobiales bacterium]
MTGVAVRPATAADVEAIVDLLESVVEEGRWLGTELPLDRREHLERLAAEVAEPEGSTLLVAVSPTGEVVGHLRLSRRPYGVATLSMYVAAVWRRRGVGSALVAAALAAACASGAHKVALQAWPNNTAALSLYTKFGFVEEGRLRRHYRRRDGSLWDAVVMGLVLDERSPGGPPDFL